MAAAEWGAWDVLTLLLLMLAGNGCGGGSGSKMRNDDKRRLGHALTSTRRVQLLSLSLSLYCAVVEAGWWLAAGGGGGRLGEQPEVQAQTHCTRRVSFMEKGRAAERLLVQECKACSPRRARRPRLAPSSRSGLLPPLSAGWRWRWRWRRRWVTGCTLIPSRTRCHW